VVAKLHYKSKTMTQNLTQKQKLYHSWGIYRLTAMGWLAVNYFRNRQDAQDYLNLLRRICPTVTYQLAFDKPVSQPTTTL
jgi:uncharacterized protein YbdZ (MbtH family)